MSNLVLYHGSSGIVQTPEYGKERFITTMALDSIAQSIWSWPRSGPVPRM